MQFSHFLHYFNEVRKMKKKNNNELKESSQIENKTKKLTEAEANSVEIL